MSKIDFNYWANLYKSDPVEFDHQRWKYITEVVNQLNTTSEKKQRILAMVNGQLMRLGRIKNPQSQQAALEQMFYEQLEKVQHALRQLQL